ncbi:MAG TPA: SIR2 family protein [Rhodanobacteraceae bacterium]
MSRKTIIFGNGLGMALDPAVFSLDHAMECAWKDSSLTAKQKQLVCNCLPKEHPKRPHSEADLGALQVALSACEFLGHFEAADAHWLTDDGRQFPKATRKFLYKTALQFQKTGKALPATFIDPLVEFIQNTKSHIGTLNYDNLLYQPLIEDGVLSGYDGQLVDGFHRDGFDPANMERKFGRTFGYYLHLHGSPLFVERDGVVIKLLQSSLTFPKDRVSSHIVLTHFDHKIMVISSSKLLLAYWNLLSRALDESSQIILFGYSGADSHLNEIIKSISKKRVKVVEWDGSGDEQQRSSFWRSAIGRDVELVHRKSILTFHDWA